MKPAKPLPAIPSSLDKNFWTVKDVARYLKVTPITIYRRIQSKNGTPLPAVRVSSKCYRIPVTKFLEWVENGGEINPNERAA